MLRRLAPIALLAIACKPAPAAEPGREAPEPSAPVAPAEPAVAPQPGELQTPASAEPETPAEPEPQTPAQPEPEAPAQPGTPAEPAATTTQASTELPKPLYRDVKSSCGRDAGVGTKLKGFRLKNLDGEEVTNGRYRKRVLLVNFWGTWCKPCLKELPEFDRLYRRYRKAGMTLLAIATDEDPEPVKELVAKRKLRAKILLGGEDYAGQYGAPNFPFTYVVDTSGTIVGSYHGFKEECMGKLEDDLRTALQSG